MEIINFLNNVFNLPVVKHFVFKSSERKRKPNEKYKSWIGFNYNQNKLDSVKLYFTFYDELSSEFISDLFNEKQVDIFFRDYKKKNLDAIISSYEFGSGFAIGLKIDLNLNVTKAFGYNLVLEEDDEMFLERNNITLSDVMPHKGVYHHFMKDLVYEKKYYYIKNKKIISDKLTTIKLFLNVNVPVLEVGFGKGFYENSNNLDEKYILLGNYNEVFDEFVNSDVACRQLVKDYHSLNDIIGIEAFCPGIYQNNKVQSFYIGYKENNIIHYDTIEKITEKLMDLKNKELK